MNGLRRHLIAIALATMSVHVGTLVTGALRACWGSEHVHAGAAAPECAMHHSSPAVHGHGHGHDHHGHGSTNPSGERSQIACNCSNDAGSPYVAANALVVARVSLPAPIEVHTPSHDRGRSVSDIDLVPLSPPPRSALA
jgi:hypothetical protein